MKKTLIISSWAPPMIGGPQNLYNLFSQFPKEDYSVITSYNSIINSKINGVEGDWLPCQYYYFDKSSDHTNSSEQINVNNRKRFNAKNVILGIINIIPLANKLFLNYLMLIITIFKFTRKTIQVQKENKSELLFGISDTGSALITTYLTHLFTKTPYALYFFDIYKENRLIGIYKYIAKIFESTLVKKAKIILVTNDRTEVFFKDKYGDSIKTSVIYNSTFTDQYKTKSTKYNPQKPYKILFTGNIYWPQEQSLLNLLEAIDNFPDLPIELHLYIPNITDHLKSIFNNKKYIRLNSAQPSEMANIQNSADLLFLPLSWDTKSPDIIATATPGKFTDYLGAGKPMLIHAPDYAYISQYAKKHKLGIVVDKNDPQLLKESIKNFFNNPEIADVYINNSLKIFYQNHDAVKNSKKLTNILNNI